MNKSKAAIAVSKFVSIIQMIAGIFFLIIFDSGILMYIFKAEYREDAGPVLLVVSLFYGLIGALLVILSRQRSSLINEYKRYVLLISADPTGSIDNLAASVGTSPDVVKRKLKLMIQRKYFVNAYIDEGINCIIIGSGAGVRTQQSSVQSFTQINIVQTPEEQQVQMIPVICKCCGGPNKVAKGTVAECEYCGSPINT